MNCQCLFQHKNGKVSHNIAREVFTIDYGNMLVHLTEENFFTFSHFVLEPDEEEVHNRLLPCGKIILQPDKSWFNYAFTENEFLQLQELLAGARSVYRIQQDIKNIFKEA